MASEQASIKVKQVLWASLSKDGKKHSGFPSVWLDEGNIPVSLDDTYKPEKTSRSRVLEFKSTVKVTFDVNSSSTWPASGELIVTNTGAIYEWLEMNRPELVQGFIDNGETEWRSILGLPALSTCPST